MPLAAPVVLPQTSRRLLGEIRVASLEHLERARRFDRLRFQLVARVLHGVAIGLLVFGPGLTAVLGLAAAAAAVGRCLRGAASAGVTARSLTGSARLAASSVAPACR